MSKYTFYIKDSYTPTTFPMRKLGEYISAYAKLLGNDKGVHLGSITESSTALEALTEPDFDDAVYKRVTSVSLGKADNDTQKSYDEINDMLKRDGATGYIEDDNKCVILPFPGRHGDLTLSYGPFDQEGSIDGEIIRVGGKDATKHIQLRDGNRVYSYIQTDEEMARELAAHMFGPTVRLNGTGKWFRTADGEWELKSFRILSFELLKDTSVSELIRQLRQVDGNGWDEAEDPMSELRP